MFKLPFEMMPGSWGLKGKTREIAKAEYELTGHALETRLLEINEGDYTMRDYAAKCNDVDLKYNKITKEEHRLRSAGLIEDSVLRDLAMAEIDYDRSELSELQYNKKVATIKGEPWVNVVKMDFNNKSSLEGSFELDWNQPFVDKLESEGYSGPTPDNVVNQWFMELCRNVALEEFDGTGNFTSDSEANLDAMRRWSSESESFPEGRKGYK
jgi:hypothetical protein